MRLPHSRVLAFSWNEMQYAPPSCKKKCCTRFWSFNFHWYWENKARRWFYLASNCETGLNLLSLHHRSSFPSWLEFKFRNTFATLAKYKFSLMFPDVTEDPHTIYCACMCLCMYERARIHALLFFFIVCQQGWNWDIQQSSTASTLMFLMGSGWNHEGTQSASYILGILGYISWVGNDTHAEWIHSMQLLLTISHIYDDIDLHNLCY